jgi:hypothetical protein
MTYAAGAMTRNRRLRSRTVAMALAWTSCSAPPRAIPRPFHAERTFALATADHPTIEVRVTNGAVTVADSVGGTALCAITATVRAGSEAQAARDAAALALAADLDDAETKVVQVLCASAALDSVHVAVTVQAPPGIAVRVLGRNASVDTRGYRGALTVDTTAGDVEAELAGGTLTASTGNGAIRVGGRFAGVDLCSDAGSIRIAAAAPATHIVASTISGDLTVELPHDVRSCIAARLRTGRPLATELPIAWSVDGRDASDGWRQFQGALGAAPRDLQVTLSSEHGTITLRPDS